MKIKPKVNDRSTADYFDKIVKVIERSDHYKVDYINERTKEWSQEIISK